MKKKIHFKVFLSNSITMPYALEKKNIKFKHNQCDSLKHFIFAH